MRKIIALTAVVSVAILSGCVGYVETRPHRFNAPPPSIHHKPMPHYSNRANVPPQVQRPYQGAPPHPVMREPVRPRNPEPNWRGQPNNQPPTNRFQNR